MSHTDMARQNSIMLHIQTSSYQTFAADITRPYTRRQIDRRERTRQVIATPIVRCWFQISLDVLSAMLPRRKNNGFLAENQWK